MRDVYLLRSLVGQIAKARQRRATRLESRERFCQVVLRQIVITGQVLALRQFVVDLRGELIASFMPQRHSLTRAIRTVRQRNVLIHQIKSSLIETSRWD